MPDHDSHNQTPSVPRKTQQHRHHERYDLAIIGGGSAGLTAAYAAQAFGAHVLLLDKERFGGDCLYYGCVPSKSLIHVARLVHQQSQAAAMGITVTPSTLDMGKISAHIQKVIGNIHEAEQTFTQGVTTGFGRVRVTSPTTLTLNDEKIRSRTIIIATGSKASIPPITGLQDVGYLTNKSVFNLTRLPRTIVIIGGGPFGVETAQALQRLGAQVTIVQRATSLLPAEDEAVATLITQVLKAEGIRIITGASVQLVHKEAGKKVVQAQQGEKTITVAADEIILATGRQPQQEDLGLDEIGVHLSEKGIKVNAYLQTSIPSIFAAGDVLGKYYFSHMATYQSGVAVRNALIPFARQKVDYRTASWCLFTDPEAAHAGLTESQAREQYAQVRTITYPLADVDRAQTENATTGFIKLVLAGRKDTLVGAHIVGIHAGEIINEFILAMRHKLTLNALIGSIHVYPTMSTGIQQAAFQAYLSSPTTRTLRTLVRTVQRFRRG